MNLVFTQMDPPHADHLAKLREKGWHPHHRPFRQVRFCRDPHTWQPPSDCCLILISSKQAAHWLRAVPYPITVPIAAVGKTSNALLGTLPRYFQGEAPSHAEALAEWIETHEKPGQKLLFLRGKTAKNTLKQKLVSSFNFCEEEVYETVPLRGTFPSIPSPLMVYFQAPSTVKDYFQHYDRTPDHIAAIGPSTAQAIRERGLSIDFQPSRPETACFTHELPTASTFMHMES